jgi:HK97 family phage prohead protease
MSKALDLQLDIARRSADGVAELSTANGQGLLEVPGLFVKSIDERKRRIRVLASSSALDRHKERILPSAFESSIVTFMQNGVVLAAHSHRLDNAEPSVIGKVVKLWIDGKGLWAVIEFAQSDLAEKYWELYKGGFMKAVSVGFIGKKGEWITEDNVRLYVHTEVELLEISCVPIPSNPEALVRQTGKGSSWLDGKREEREEKKMLAEIYRDNPNFDRDAEEFAELLLRGDLTDGGESPDRPEGRRESVIIERGMFVQAVGGKCKDRFADLVGGVK